MADWVTISSLATAGGTLVLAGATFASVRSANRAARAAERSMLAGMRPLLMPSHLEDPPQKIGFVDKWFSAPGGGGDRRGHGQCRVPRVRRSGMPAPASPCCTAGTSSLIPLRQRRRHAPIEQFHSLTRDLYISANDVGFWQGAFRDRSRRVLGARDAIDTRERLVVDVLYGDHEGGQRVVTRFSMTPRKDDGWMVSAARHWNIDRPDPR